MDNLSYYYKGNQLIAVNDANTANNTNDFYDRGFTAIPVSTNSSTWEYGYDGNGNFTKDVNKGIVSVQYNPMNLPTVFDFGNNNRVEYNYSYAGTKLRKQVYTSGALTGSTDYVNGFVYENNTPSYMLFDEGRILLANGTGSPEYYLKDHLGNVRVAFSPSGTINQVNSYYPFGMNIYGLTSTETISTKNKYLYNGKEMQGDFGLNLLDYGARFYDPVIGRFNVIDQMSEIHQNYTPYHYCFNNTINFKDLFGLDTIPAQQGDKLPVKKDDVIKMPDGTEATMSFDAVVITGEKTDKKDSDKKDKPEITVKDEEKEDKNPAGDILKAGMMGAGALSLDPVPGDEVVVAGATLITAGVVWLGYEIYEFAHRKNARLSTKGDHEKGEARSKQDQGGSKGEKFTKGPRPPGVKGPWPRKIK